LTLAISSTSEPSLVIDNTRKLLADSATFRALMEVATPTLAYARAFLGYTDDDGVALEAAYPRTIVANGRFAQRKTATTGGKTEAMVHVEIEVPVPTAYTSLDQDAYIWINNKIGDMIAEIWVLSWNGSEATLNTGKTHINVTEIEVDEIGKSDLTIQNGVALVGAVLSLTIAGRI
jgi:hypothetical protein